MGACFEHRGLVDEHQPLLRQSSEKLADHGCNFGVADHLGVRISREELFERCRMVRLHVLDDHIVERTSAQHIGHILKKDLAHGLVDRVKQDGTLIHQQIGIVGNPAGHRIDSLKHGKPAVVCADPKEVIRHFSCAMHIHSPDYYCRYVTACRPFDGR
ncbi:hypothetical protein SDC9_95904 [bioreactor metagenome]|uniref:Uncharacterized protein n=1 Tax=bioreactor metagenome TaxID=1076179 RepID=A0A645A8C7_9ZZZZ